MGVNEIISGGCVWINMKGWFFFVFHIWKDSYLSVYVWISWSDLNKFQVLSSDHSHLSTCEMPENVKIFNSLIKIDLLYYWVEKRVKNQS